MSHSDKQMEIIGTLAFIVLLISIIGNFVFPIWLFRATAIILSSTIVGFFLTGLFQFLAEIIWGIRFNAVGNLTLEYKYTKDDFQIAYNILQFVITAFSAFVIDELLGTVFNNWAIGYAATPLPVILAIISIALEIFVVFFGIWYLCGHKYEFV